MCAFAAEKKQTIVRKIRTGDLRGLLRLIDANWRVQLRLSPHELPAKIKHIPSFLAEDGVGIRGFMMIEPSSSNIAIIAGVGLRDTWSVTPFLDLILPQIQQTARELNLKGLVYIGNASWLSDELERHGFETREWVAAFEREGAAPPPHPVLVPATLRQAHFNDLPFLLALDNLAFEHIWHKSAGNFSEALVQAGSFQVALLDNKVVAFEWSEMYGKHAHLTRLAVHPAYQGQGIGAQLLYQAIIDVLGQGATRITLNTQENNQRSQLLYERFGFVNTGYRMPVMWQDLG
jgi:ribosomal-protein-alanine N-acetyltransferase